MVSYKKRKKTEFSAYDCKITKNILSRCLIDKQNSATYPSERREKKEKTNFLFLIKSLLLFCSPLELMYLCRDKITKIKKMRSRTSDWFETKIRYDKTMEDGTQKKVTEQYVVDALSFTEAENTIIENTVKESGYMRCLLWESMRCQMRAKQSQKQNGLRVLAAAFVILKKK